MAERPGVKKGKDVPTPHTIKELAKSPEEMKKKMEESKVWVQAGMAIDAKK